VPAQQKPAIAGVRLGFASSPLAPQPDGPVRGHFHGHARSCLTGNSTRPQPRPHHGSHFITDKNTCDDVSANKSLFGNEHETPSTRSLLSRAGPAGLGGDTWAALGPDQEDSGGAGGIWEWLGWGVIAEAVNNHSCSDIRARNRTRFANVSLGTDGATRGRPPGPGAIQ